MVLDPVTNFAIVQVSTGYDASATSIVLTSGHGAKLPSTGSYNLVWWNYTDYSNPSDDPNVEIIRVTARVTDTLTVTRAQEGTLASTKNTAGKTYKMTLGVTAKAVTDIDTNLSAMLPLAGGTMTGVINTTVADVEVVGKNKYRPLLNYAGTPIAIYQDYYWNGSSYVATNSHGFGYGALLNNVGPYSNGFGYYSLQNNVGPYSNGFGYQSLQNNMGDRSNGFGMYALNNNVGSGCNGFGYQPLFWNNWSFVISIGHQTSSYFAPDATTDKSFDYSCVDGTAHTITFAAAHGFGTVGGKVNLKFTLTAGTAPTGLTNSTVYQFTVTSTTVLTLTGITSQGSVDFTGKLTNSVNITNSIAIGYNANASKQNQVVLGSSSITEVQAGAGGTATVIAKQFQLSALNTAPASATDTGTLGEIRIVNGFIYVCVATNTWQRAALVSW